VGMNLDVININIQNTTNGIVPISILGNVGDQMDNSNATTQYSWNLGTFAITNENTIILQYKGVNDINFGIVTIDFIGTSINNVVDALNTLNLGSFFITTSGGNTIINNYNQNFVFSVLNILNPSSSSTLSYSFSFNAVGMFAEIFKNAVSQILSNSPSFTSGNISVVSGNNILFNVSVSGNTKPTNYFVYNITTKTYIVNATITNGVDVGYPFTIQPNTSYLIGMQN
jgi:hypothetical protein